MTTIEAISVINPSEAVTDSGLKLAQVIVRELEHVEVVNVSFAGLRGVPSSFFNVFVSYILDAVGSGAFAARVQLQFDSSVQRDTFDRSLQAAHGPQV